MTTELAEELSLLTDDDHNEDRHLYKAINYLRTVDENVLDEECAKVSLMVPDLSTLLDEL